MQTQHFISFKKIYILFILLYIFAFSILLCGVKHFTKALEAAENAVTTAADGSAARTTTLATDSEADQELQKSIAKNIIRLHVIANSDSDADQALKLAVRDEIITSLQEVLQNSNSREQAESLLLSQTPEIEKAAYRVLSRHHSNYNVKISLCDRYFPIKQYGDLTFPAGEYRALCVEIGEAKGRNWWCVLFPSLCFVDETTATVPDSSKEKLKNTLSEEEYEALQENTPPEIRFGLLDWFEKHF